MEIKNISVILFVDVVAADCSFITFDKGLLFWMTSTSVSLFGNVSPSYTVQFKSRRLKNWTNLFDDWH